MGLTEEEFLNIVNVTGTGGTQVHIWYDSDTSYIKGLTIPITLNGESLLGYLQQAEQVIIPVDSNGLTAILIITSAVFLTAEYYYIQVEPYYIDIGANILNLSSGVIFVPDILGLVFINGDYNALFNNIQQNRQSDYILQGENITFAFVQDSLYGDTPWTRARYNGTKTTPEDFSTISPILVGGEFKGSYFPNTITNDYIFSLPPEEKVFTDYYYSGEGTVPTYTLTVSDFTRNGAFPSSAFPGQNILVVNIPPSSSNRIEVGDLLILGSGSLSDLVGEIIKVNTVEVITPISAKISVRRGWNTTPTTTLIDPPTPGDEVIYKIAPERVFNLSRNRVEIPSQGKLQIKSTQDIVYIDELGFITSGSAYTP